MKKLFALGLSAAMLLSLVGAVFAQPPAGQTAKVLDTGITVNVPGTAVEGSPALDVIPLGEAKDVDGRLVEGYMFIHYKDAFSHKPGHNPGGGGKPATNKCYSFLANGAKWKITEPYLVNPINSVGLDESLVRSTVANGLSKWEDASDGTVGEGLSKNIIGGEESGVVDGADTSSPDGKNEVMFGDIDSSGAIAVTIVWGIFSGPPFARELVEWDQVYDQVDFDWSSSGEAEKMDFENISTHEHGHVFGLGHPDDSCTEETMYRFAAPGEIKKRDLETGDITGITQLYK